MINLKIDEDTVVELLVERIKHWTNEDDIIGLYEKYYENLAYGGGFEGCEFDVMGIVDNDWVNWTNVYTTEDFQKEWGDKAENEERILAKDGDLLLVYVG